MFKESIIWKCMIGLFLPKVPFLSCCQKHDSVFTSDIASCSLCSVAHLTYFACITSISKKYNQKAATVPVVKKIRHG